MCFQQTSIFESIFPASSYSPNNIRLHYDVHCGLLDQAGSPRTYIGVLRGTVALAVPFHRMGWEQRRLLDVRGNFFPAGGCADSVSV
eukprot:s624_g5.t1